MDSPRSPLPDQIVRWAGITVVLVVLASAIAVYGVLVWRLLSWLAG